MNNIHIISNEMTAFEKRFYQNIEKAISLGASDIHFEPHEGKYVICLHIDQIRYDIDEIIDHPNRLQRFIEIAKEKCNFDTNKIRVIQDSRFSLPKLGYNFRANLIPVNHGEKICLRLLEIGKEFYLDNYKLRIDAKNDFKLALSKAQGLIIVSGPTGSGKTTLLYNGLSYVDRKRKNIHTIEEPIEYIIDRFNQSEVDKKRNVNFSDLLRSLMRQHPNLILIGEVRDCETAEAAIQASNTGHLVLTTIHANSLAEINTRMLDFGVNPRVLEANLIFSSAQRLLPKNCQNCLQDDVDQNSIFKFKLRKIFNIKENFIFKNSKGCSECLNGVKGVELIFEWGIRDYNAEDKKFSYEMKDNLLVQIGNLLCEGKINADTAYSFIS